MLAEKVELAKQLLLNEAPGALLSSFGKDSMVMLHLARAAGLDLPVVFFKEPFFPEKYAFANQVILAWGLVVYDYPPFQVSLTKKAGQFEVLNFHQVGPTTADYLWLPTGIVPPEAGEPFLCGLRDLLAKPTGTFQFPWTTLFIGHKSSDVDPMYGEVPLKAAVVPGKVKVVFPLKDFTDEDVWAYTLEQGLPIHRSRYNEADGWKEFPSKRTNPDYFPTCMNCLDRDQPEEVDCPLWGKAQNVSSQVDYQEVVMPNYVEKES
jgi:hypothetical protein